MEDLSEAEGEGGLGTRIHERFAACGAELDLPVRIDCPRAAEVASD